MVQRSLSRSFMSMVMLLSSCLMFGQTIQLKTEFELGAPFTKNFYVASDDGSYAATVLDTIGIVRQRIWPSLHRDTLVKPDSITKLSAIGYSKTTLFVRYVSQSSGAVGLALIDNDDTTWNPMPDAFPIDDARLGRLRSISQCTTAPGTGTAMVVSSYVSPTSQQTARSVMIDTRTRKVLRTYDSLAIARTSPYGREYYSFRYTTDSSARFCTYFDATTGEMLRTIRVRNEYAGGGSTGLDHIMYTPYALGNVEDVPVDFPPGRYIVGCLAAPNVYCTLRDSAGMILIESFNVLDRSVTRIDTLRGSDMRIAVNDVEHLLIVRGYGPERLLVYTYDEVVGKHGLVCVRNRDTANVFDRISYNVVYLSPNTNITTIATIDGTPYVMSGRTTTLLLASEQPGTIPFTAEARSSQGSVLDTASIAPLVVRFPGSFVSATRVQHDVYDLALSEDEQSLAVICDSMSTIVQLSGTPQPLFQPQLTMDIRAPVFEITQSPLLPSSAKVITIDRPGDTASPSYHRTIDQVIIHEGLDDSLTVRSVSLPANFDAMNAYTVSSRDQRVLGLWIRRRDLRTGRLYLTTNVSGTWSPIGDPNGFEIPLAYDVDLALAGRVVVNDAMGHVYVFDAVGGTMLDSIEITDWGFARLMNDSTLVGTRNIWRKQFGSWRKDLDLRENRIFNVTRYSSTHSVLLPHDFDGTGYIVRHSTSELVDSIGSGFGSAPRAAIFSHRFHGLFVGYAYGYVGFVPLPTDFEDPTSVADDSTFIPHGSITSCTLYNVDGQKVGEIRCNAPLTSRALIERGFSAGWYLAVYMHEMGYRRSEPIVVFE